MEFVRGGLVWTSEDVQVLVWTSEDVQVFVDVQVTGFRQGSGVGQVHGLHCLDVPPCHGP